MKPTTRDAIAERLADYDRLVEVGVGNRTDVAAALVEAGARVTATDIEPRAVPDRVEFVVDDVTDPAPEVYADADAMYALNLPPELHRPALTAATDHDAALAFTTLGADQPTVPVTRETVPGDTLFRVERG